MFGFGKKKLQLKRRTPGIFGSIWNAFWGNSQSTNPGFYEAARTDDINRNGHFHFAEYIDAYNDPEARRQLAARAHYESANNSTLSGAADTFAAETVGVGPSMQIVPEKDENGDTTGEWSMISEELRREIEIKYEDWKKDAGLAMKQRTAKRCKVIRGESLGYFYPIQLTESAARFPNPVKLSYRVVEPSRLDSIRYDFKGRADEDGFVDGIKYDAYHNPVTYRLQKDLDTAANQLPGAYDGGTQDIDAKYVVHSFKHEMPEQRRGVSWFASALDLSFLARQFIKSVTIAARNGARLFGFIQTNLPPDFADNVEGEEACDLYLPTPGDKFELTDDDIRYLPENSSIQMTTPSQPMATAPEFLKTLTNHIGRAFGMPTNVISKTSEDSNYSSGRLDYQQWDRDVAIERDQDVEEFWKLSFKLWFQEAVRIEGYFVGEGADEMVAKATVTDSYPVCPRVTFRFTHRGFIDPRKEVAAATERMRNGTSSLSDEIAVLGKDAETVISRMAEDLGIEVSEQQANIRRFLYSESSEQQVSQNISNAIQETLEDLVSEEMSRK